MRDINTYCVRLIPACRLTSKIPIVVALSLGFLSWMQMPSFLLVFTMLCCYIHAFTSPCIRLDFLIFVMICWMSGLCSSQRRSIDTRHDNLIIVRGIENHFSLDL